MSSIKRVDGFGCVGCYCNREFEGFPVCFTHPQITETESEYLLFAYRRVPSYALESSERPEWCPLNR